MTNRNKKTLGGLLLFGTLAVGSCVAPPVRLPDLPLAEVKPYFGEAAKVETIDTAFYQVKDANGRVLGTVLFSSPYSDNIEGYNGATPLLIALDANGNIAKVALLDNNETPRFAQRVVDGGLYSSWDGLAPAEAIGLQVDAVSGATYTSEGVKKSLVARLEAYQRQLTKEPEEQPSFWQRLFAKKNA